MLRRDSWTMTRGLAVILYPPHNPLKSIATTDLIVAG